MVAMISVLLTFSPSHGQELDEHLKLLKPLTRNNWVGKMPRFGEGATREVVWKVLWNGKAVQQTTNVKFLNSVTEAYFYWDFHKQEIGVFSITSNGNFFQAHVSGDGGKILIYGDITFPDKKLKFRNTFELTEEGKLLDKWFTLQDGQWKPGHTFELSATKE